MNFNLGSIFIISLIVFGLLFSSLYFLQSPANYQNTSNFEQPLVKQDLFDFENNSKQNLKQELDSRFLPIWTDYALGAIIAIITGILSAHFIELIRAKKKKKKLKAILKIEFSSLKKIANRNVRLINNELEIINGHETIVMSLSKFSDYFWDLSKDLLSEDQKFHALRLLKKLNSELNSLNSIIESRDNYRITNPAISNYHTTLKTFDLTIKNLLEDLVKLIEKIEIHKDIQC